MKSRNQHAKISRRRRQAPSRWVIASGVTLCNVFAVAPALAQTSPAVPAAPDSAASAPATTGAKQAPPTNLGAVTVTSRRRAERLQDVPLSITAITSKQLEDSGAKNLLDIAKLTPGLTINSAGSEANVNITIRGLADLSGGANDPNVAVFIDGVYQANRSAISLGLMDLERIEVVKGPVSALYGRNAYAGAINYVTKKPLDSFEASVTGGIASSGGRTAKASIGGPIQPGVLDFRLVVAHDESDGTYKDQVNGLRAGGYKKNDGALTVSITPTKEFSVIASSYYGDDFFGAQSAAYLDNNCGPINKSGVNATVNNGAGAFTQYCGKLDPTQHPVEVAPIAASAGQAGNKRRVQADTLRAAYDFGAVEASALIGYNKVKDQRYADFTGHRDGIPFITAPNPPGTIYKLKELFGADANNSDKSLELRVATKQNQALRGSAGLYWFNATSTATTLIGADGSGLPPGTTLPAGSTGSPVPHERWRLQQVELHADQLHRQDLLAVRLDRVRRDPRLDAAGRGAQHARDQVVRHRAQRLHRQHRPPVWRGRHRLGRLQLQQLPRQRALQARRRFDGLRAAGPTARRPAASTSAPRPSPS